MSLLGSIMLLVLYRKLFVRNVRCDGPRMYAAAIRV